MATTTCKTDLGSVLRYHREKAELRREHVAVYLGRSVQAVTDWERNRRAPRLVLIVELARLYGVDVAELATAEVPRRERRGQGAATA
ncbi:MAG: helix-turn-helix domain-containing protein [Pseudonocardiaceae bacterium]